MKKLFERNDLLIIIAVCVVTIILLIPRFVGENGATAEISVDGKIIKEIELDKTEGMYQFTTETEPSVTITAEKGKICVSDADCKDKLCVKSGWLTSEGDMAVCLPAKVVVNIKGSSTKNAPDVITY